MQNHAYTNLTLFPSRRNFLHLLPFIHVRPSPTGRAFDFGPALSSVTAVGLAANAINPPSLPVPTSACATGMMRRTLAGVACLIQIASNR